MAKPATKERDKGGKAAAAPRNGPGARPTGNKIALRYALVAAAAGVVTGLLVTFSVVAEMRRAAEPKYQAQAASEGQMRGLLLALFGGVLGGVGGFVLGGRLSSRVRELSGSVQKLGRGGVEVRVRADGTDEVTALARSLQYLASDLTALLKDLAAQEEQGGGAMANMDPQVRQLRDRALPQQLPQVAGYEVDAALSQGSRGGLDYYDVVPTEHGAVCYHVSGEGNATVSVVASRMARDELHRALAQNATPRKALTHANKVLKQQLPAGACAKATLLQLGEEGAKLYQAGARAPLWICQRGEVLELAAEGLALGLDDGPVFEKALRPQEIAMSPGTRLVLVNEAGLRMAELLELVKQLTPRHTAMFMNMVLGNLEQNAGEGGLREDVVLLTAKRTGQVG